MATNLGNLSIPAGLTSETVYVPSRGDTTVEHASVVVGADGRHSRVAEAVRPVPYHEKPPLLAAYYTYWSGLPMHGRFETYIRERRAFAAVPTHGDLTMVIVG